MATAKPGARVCANIQIGYPSDWDDIPDCPFHIPDPRRFQGARARSQREPRRVPHAGGGHRGRDAVPLGQGDEADRSARGMARREITALFDRLSPSTPIGQDASVFKQRVSPRRLTRS